MKKNKRNIVPSKIIRAFAPGKTEHQFDITASFYASHYAEPELLGDEGRKHRLKSSHSLITGERPKPPETQVTVDVLDLPSLEDFLEDPTFYSEQIAFPVPPVTSVLSRPASAASFHSSGLGTGNGLDVERAVLTGVLQKFARPGKHNHVIKATWTPEGCVVQRATNTRPLWDLLAPPRDRYMCVPYDSPEPPAVIVSSVLGTVFPQRVKDTCNAIAEHILNVTLGQSLLQPSQPSLTPCPLYLLLHIPTLNAHTHHR